MSGKYDISHELHEDSWEETGDDSKKSIEEELMINRYFVRELSWEEQMQPRDLVCQMENY